MNPQFSALKNLPTEQLKQYPIHEIIQCVIAALQVDEDKCVVFNFAFTKLLRLVPIEQQSDEIFSKVLPILKDIFDQQCNCLKNAFCIDPATADYSQLQTIFQLMTNLVKNVLKTFSQAEKAKYEISKIELLIRAALYMLNATFTMIESYSLTSAIAAILLTEVRSLQTSLMQLWLSGHFSIHPKVSDLQCCRKLLSGLAELGYRQGNSSELKLMAETWKYFIKLSTEVAKIYQEYTKSRMVDTDSEDASDLLGWFPESFEHICDAILTRIEQMFNNVNIVDNSKLNMFCLKLLQKLMSVYANTTDLTGGVAFIEFYEKIIHLRITNEKSNLGPHLTSLDENCSQILQEICGCSKFIDTFYSESLDRIHVGMRIISLLSNGSMGNKNLFLSDNSDRNILHFVLLTCLPQEPSHLLTSPELYNQIMISSTMLALANIQKQEIIEPLLDVLIEAVLCDDIFVGQLAMDIWILLIRHLPIESRLPYYSAWSEINQELSVQPSNPSNVFVKIIVQNIYDSLPDVHRTQIVSELRDDDISQIAAMGMERIASHNIVVAENCSRALTTAVSDLLERINSGDRTTKSHNQLIDIFCEFSRMPGRSTIKLPRLLQPCQQVCSHISKLLSLPMVNESEPMLGLLNASVRIMVIQQMLYDNPGFSHHSKSSLSPLKLKRISALAHLDVAQVFYNADGITIPPQLLTMLLEFAKYRSEQYSDSLIVCRSLLIINSLMKTNAIIGSHQLDEPSINGAIDVDDGDYFDEISKISRNYGCIGKDSCHDNQPKTSEQCKAFEKCLDQMVLQAKQLDGIYTSNKHGVDLYRYANQLALIRTVLQKLQ